MLILKVNFKPIQKICRPYRKSIDLTTMETLISTFGASVVGSVAWKKHQNNSKKTADMSSKIIRHSSSSRLVRHLSMNSKWSDYNDDDESFIQDLPKVELHVVRRQFLMQRSHHFDEYNINLLTCQYRRTVYFKHLDGSFDADFLWNYMKEHPESVYCLPVQVIPPWDPTKTLPIRNNVMQCQTSKDFYKLCTCRGYRSLKEMLNCFEVFLPLVRGNVQLIEQLSYDFCQRQWEQNVVYCEVRYSPHLLAEAFTTTATNDGNTGNNYDEWTNSHENTVITPDAVFAAVTKGLRRGCEKYPNLTINQILCCITWRPDWAESTLNMATLHQYAFPCAVVGVDVAAGEEHFNGQEFPDLFGPHFAMAEEAKKRHIPLTIHAGEVPTDAAGENIRRAVLEYGACRIGHGYRMSDDAATMELVRSNNVHVEVCPTSSVETGGWVYDDTNESRDWKNHPATVMLKHGVSLCLNSDDPAVFHTSLSWQYRIALAKMSFSRQDLIRMNLDAIKASWCSDEEKERLAKLICCYGHEIGIDSYQSCQCDGIMHQSHSSWWKSKTDSFFDRVYLRDEDVKT